MTTPTAPSVNIKLLNDLGPTASSDPEKAKFLSWFLSLQAKK